MMATQLREHRELPRPHRENRAARMPLAQRQRSVAAREFVELTRDAVDRPAQLFETGRGKRAADEAEGFARPREWRIEQLDLDLPGEQFLHRAVVPPREVARRLQPHALQRQQLEDLRAMQAHEQPVEFVRLHFERCGDRAERPGQRSADALEEHGARCPNEMALVGDRLFVADIDKLEDENTCPSCGKHGTFTEPRSSPTGEARAKAMRAE